MILAVEIQDMYELSRALYPPDLVPRCEELAGAVLQAQVLAVEIVQDVRTVPNSVSLTMSLGARNWLVPSSRLRFSLLK